MSLTTQLSKLAIVRASNRRRLWLAAAGVFVFLATIAAVRWAGSNNQPPTNRGFGLDFIAFYTAGDFVAHSQSNRLYDLEAVRIYQHDLAARHHIDLGHAIGPWWNPPFYALLFAPFSLLPWPQATLIWLACNLICFAFACVLLCRMLPPQTTWRSSMLVPILVVLSAPFILTISHAQNSCTSLLLLAATVAAWRAPKPLLAGLIGGLLFYKPQVAAVVAIMIVIDLGWKALAGYALTGTTLLLINLIALPGTLSDYLHRLPVNVHSFQTQANYPWEQHLTLKAFFRLLVQGHQMGDATPLVLGATALGTVCLFGLLVRAAIQVRWHCRQLNEVAESSPSQGPPEGKNTYRDRLIAATIATAPLLMPFYFDYDLLLLTVPAVLLAVENSSDLRPSERRLNRPAIAVWCAIYGWMMINTDVAEQTHVNLAVPLLTILAIVLILRASWRPLGIQFAARPTSLGPALQPVPA